MSKKKAVKKETKHKEGVWFVERDAPDWNVAMLTKFSIIRQQGTYQSRAQARAEAKRLNEETKVKGCNQGATQKEAIDSVPAHAVPDVADPVSRAEDRAEMQEADAASKRRSAEGAPAGFLEDF